MIALLWATLPASAGLVGATHHGEVVGEGVRWTTQLRTTPGELRLATPVPKDDMLDYRGFELVLVDDQVTALRPLGDRDARTLLTRQPTQASLRPPLFIDPAGLQHVSVEGLRFKPNATSNVTPRIGWSGTRGVTASDRRQFYRSMRVGRTDKLGGLVMRVDAPLTAGIAGTLAPAGRPGIGPLVGAISAGLILLLAMATGYRWLEAQARRERLLSWISEGASEPEGS